MEGDGEVWLELSTVCRCFFGGTLVQKWAVKLGPLLVDIGLLIPQQTSHCGVILNVQSHADPRDELPSPESCLWGGCAVNTIFPRRNP